MRGWKRRALVGGMIAAGCWLLAEAAVTTLARDTLIRWQSPVPRSPSGAPYLPGNPYLLWEMVPGQRTELGVQVTVNDLGLRGPAIAQTKPPGIRRVLVVGDSTVYGHGVADEAVFARRLDAALGPGVEVLNGGVPGYTTEQSLNLLSLRLWDLEPDLLIIASLWSDNNFDSFVDRELVSSHRAFEGRWSTPLAQAAAHSAVYRFLDWHLRIAERETAVREVGWMLGRAPQGDRRRVAVNEYAQNLQRMVDAATVHGADVAFLGLANHVDLGAETSGAHAWQLYREVMADAATRNGAPLVSVPAIFAESGLTWKALFMDQMHPTAQGHTLIAEALVDALGPWMEGTALAQPSAAPVPRYEDPYTRGEPSAGATGPGPSGRGEIRGLVHTATPTPLQIDVLITDPRTGEAIQVAGERLPGPGTFTLAVPADRPITLRVYRDPDGDGPGPGDPLVDFPTQPIQADPQAPTLIHIDLDARTLEPR